MSEPNLLCDPRAHLSRRTLLGGGVGGSLLSMLAGRLAWGEASGALDRSRPKSVILLWLEGGPSQLETFDPHPGTAIGGPTGAIQTSAGKLRIADTLPRTAERMHLGSLVRSVTSQEGDHERAIYNLKTGYRPDPTLVHPSIGSILCHQFPEQLEIPRHISINPGNSPARGGYLGPVYDAFKMGDPKDPVPDLESPVEPARLTRRLDDLKVLERSFRRVRLQDLDRNRTLHRSATASALEMMSSEQVRAFDVSSEPRSVRASFGETPFGRGALAAARLIQTGVRCVEVTLGGWDSHVTNHSLQSSACETLDPALAALLDRLEEQDLLETTLVVCGGEFGRTPRHNPAEGRDHWPHGFSIFLAGCGIRRGGVHGATAPQPQLDPARPLADLDAPVTVADVHATILAALDVPYGDELDTPIGRPMKRSEGQPIETLLKV